MKSKKSCLSVSKWAIVAIIAIFTIVLYYVLFFNQQRTYQITESYRITSENGSETYLNVCLPISGGFQTISDYTIEGLDDYYIESYNGWNELTAAIPPNNSEALITMSYSVKLTRNAPPWDGEVLDGYTEAQQFVDSDNEDIIRLGEQLRGENEYETARNIWRHVNKTIRLSSGTQVNAAQLCASELLKYPVGVCGDYAILMTALLRAEGIPARMISGLTLEIYELNKASDWNHPGIAHAWVEFFADGKWHFADPTWGKFEKSDTSHLSYGTYQMYAMSDFQQSRFEAIKSAGFYIVGAMSAPLMFIVYSTDENASVVPRADVSFSLFR